MSTHQVRAFLAMQLPLLIIGSTVRTEEAPRPESAVAKSAIAAIHSGARTRRDVSGWGVGLSIDKPVYSAQDTLVHATAVLWNRSPIDSGRTLFFRGITVGCELSWQLKDGFGASISGAPPGPVACLFSLDPIELASGEFVSRYFQVPIEGLPLGVYRLHLEWRESDGPWGTNGPQGPGLGKPSASIDFLIE